MGLLLLLTAPCYTHGNGKGRLSMLRDMKGQEDVKFQEKFWSTSIHSAKIMSDSNLASKSREKQKLINRF